MSGTTGKGQRTRRLKMKEDAVKMKEDVVKMKEHIDRLDKHKHDMCSPPAFGLTSSSSVSRQ
eukprot:SAG22_NODE_19157_length_277_cov_1.134831_1_plen_61_part_10